MTNKPSKLPSEFNVDMLTISAEGPMFSQHRPLNALISRKIVLKDKQGQILDRVNEFNLFTGRGLRMQQTDDGPIPEIIQVAHVEIDIPDPE